MQKCERCWRCNINHDPHGKLCDTHYLTGVLEFIMEELEDAGMGDSVECEAAREALRNAE